jgi:hypothetical protein
MSLSNGFITADNARNNNVANAAIHSEISTIETMILAEANKGFTSVDITSSTMTDQTLATTISVSSVDASANTITFVGVYASGTPVTITATTLPSPLSSNTVYYLVAQPTTNVYKLAVSKQKALQASLDTIDLTSTGNTVSVNIQPQSLLYFNAWQNMAYNREYVALSDHMQKVIAYFVGYGYTIDRIQVDTNTQRFFWRILW